MSLFTVTLFIFNWSIGLWDQDEAAYAGFARAMNETGNYLIPEYPWSFIHRKPPLHFWFNAFWFTVFGAGEWATRFSSALSVIGTLLVIWRLGGYVFGKEIGRLGAIISACSLYAVFLTKIAVTDADLMFFQTLAIFSLLAFLKHKNWWYLIGLWFGVAGAALVKGPPVFVVVFGILGLTFFVRKYRITSIVAFFVAVLGFIPLYLWGVATWQQDDGEFVTWLIDWYILSRNTPFATQTGPPGYFLIFYLLTFFAFSGFLLGGIKNVFKDVWQKQWNSDAFLLVAWIVPGWFLYEFMPSKLPTYAIACFGAVGILIARSVVFAQENKTFKRLNFFPLAIFSILGLGIVAAGFVYLNFLSAIIMLVLGVAILAIGLRNFQKNRAKENNIFLACLGMLLVSFTVFAVVVPGIDDKRSAGKIVAQKIASTKTSNLVVTHKLQLPSLLFYFEEANIPFDLLYKPEQWQKHATRGDSFLFLNINNDDRKDFERDHPNYEVDSLEGWQSDRGKVIMYYWYVVK